MYSLLGVRLAVYLLSHQKRMCIPKAPFVLRMDDPDWKSGIMAIDPRLGVDVWGGWSK